MPKVSVIIPVYNVEDYLKECLDSVVNQTLKDIEVICVDDGSTDSSLDILKAYAEKDSRVKVVEQGNAGVSTARNNGVSVATGEYIMFLDSDDYLERNACDELYSKITKSKADVVVFGFNECEDGERQLGELTKDVLMKEGVFVRDELNYDEFLPLTTYCWDKIYRAEFIKNMPFETSVKCCEDGLFNADVLSKNPKISAFDKPLYNYRVNRVGSAMHNVSKCVKNDFLALKYLVNSKSYLDSNERFKVFYLKKHISGFIYHYNRATSIVVKFKFTMEFIGIRKWIKTNIPKVLLKRCKEYRRLGKITVLSPIFNLIFSMRNVSKKRKIVTVLGFKIKLKRKKK